MDKYEFLKQMYINNKLEGEYNGEKLKFENQEQLLAEIKEICERVVQIDKLEQQVWLVSEENDIPEKEAESCGCCEHENERMKDQQGTVEESTEDLIKKLEDRLGMKIHIFNVNPQKELRRKMHEYEAANWLKLQTRPRYTLFDFVNDIIR